MANTKREYKPGMERRNSIPEPRLECPECGAVMRRAKNSYRPNTRYMCPVAADEKLEEVEYDTPMLLHEGFRAYTEEELKCQTSIG